jgi:peptidoglycan/xylan/chitin deacetylase (PgdA/CDA1 family)
MSAKVHKKYASWQEDVRTASPFVIVCGIVAIFYFLYRIALVAYPIAVIEQNALHAQNKTIVCGQEEGNHLQDPSPVLSSNYQKRIQSEASLSPNLVANAAITDVDPITIQPTGYNHNIEDSAVSYQYLKDLSDNSLLLRVSSTKDASQAKNQTPPAWLPPLAQVTPNHTYAYSFQYRSSVPIDVATEHSKNGANPAYTGIVTLKASDAWQTFTAHFDNSDSAATFRVIANATKAGFVDTRAFDVHEIRNAELSSGIVSVTFDDGWESVTSKALPILDKYHIRTTQYIISSVAAANVTDYMDFGTIKRLKQSGSEIGSHSLTHCNQTTLDKNTLEDNAKRSKKILEDQGLGPVTSFAYPLGQYNETTQATYSKYYSFIRSSDFGYNDRYFDETDIHSIGILDKTSDAQIKSWLDYAKAHKQWIVLVYHRVNDAGEYNVSTDQLGRQMALVEQSGLKILPLGEAATSIRH